MRIDTAAERPRNNTLREAPACGPMWASAPTEKLQVVRWGGTMLCIILYEKSSLGGREDDTVIYIFLCKHPLHQQQQAEARNPQDADDDGIEPAQP